jgi:L-alanine-DL-glutamate epimerase-like enolase superfamily enzyme
LKTSDVLDPDGSITLPKAPGLGYEIVWDYIHANTLSADREPALASH